MKKVFISYSHKDKDWVRGWLLPKLEDQAIETHIDYRDFEIGVASVLNMERAVEKCAKTLLVLTQNWIDSEFTQFEGIMVQTDDPIGLHKKILPLKLDGCELPRRLKIVTYADFRHEDNWDFELGRLSKQIKEDFAKVAPPKVAWLPLSDENIDISRLPGTPYELFGRQKELKTLNQAWESEDTNVVSFVAYGGTGKSTLVNKWLEKLRWDNYRGANKVFGWSFYSQGTSERATSADKFIAEALAWFGDPDPKKGSPWDKGRRLADLVRKEKTLLILDGLEPLQSKLERGKIKDPALSMLVTELARNNNGLCVITTREEVAELERFDKGVLQLNLDQISKEAGRALLRVGGVQGTDEQLEAASEQFGNHALAINLLASYLHGIEGHHIQNAANIADLDIPIEKGRHPRRVIAAFEERFGEGPQIQLLNILGLFDRPAEMAAVEAVYKDSPIEGLTDQLQGLTEAQFNELLEELRDRKLLAPKSKHNPNVVDCHPLVREHFGEKLSKDKPQAWKEAHRRLYEYYKSVPEDEFPDTLDKMEPLFAAVTQGCLAGAHTKVWQDVYWKRISRGNEFYSTRQLGAFGADLAAVSCFFEKPWSKPASDLRESRQALVLNLAGFALRALGRLTEAAEPISAGMQLQAEQEDWQNAAIAAGNLSELYLTLGDVKKAVDYGRRSVEYADKSADWTQEMRRRTNLAEPLHQAGDIGDSEGLFGEAEEMQKEHQPEYTYLYSLQGFKFCDLLLSQGRYEEVQKRAQKFFEWRLPSDSLLDIALDNLSLGRAYLLEAAKQGKSKKGDPSTGLRAGLEKAEGFLNDAVDGLREAGVQDYLVRGLLARAELYRYQQSWKKARADLEDAKEIAERGQMNLYMADYHLEAARLCLAETQDSEYRILNTECRITKLEEAREHWKKAQEGEAEREDSEYRISPQDALRHNTECRIEKLNEARQHYEEAAKRVEDMGYHRRDPEVLLIKAELQSRAGDKAAAKKTLQAAERRINEMGCHRWDVEVERIVKREE